MRLLGCGSKHSFCNLIGRGTYLGADMAVSAADGSRSQNTHEGDAQSTYHGRCCAAVLAAQPKPMNTKENNQIQIEAQRPRLAEEAKPMKTLVWALEFRESTPSFFRKG